MAFDELGRSAATLPFDWMCTTLDGILHFLNTDFQGFFDFNTTDSSNVGGVSFTVYRTAMHSWWHDDPTDLATREKLQRRIERFKAMQATTSPILFARLAVSTDELPKVGNLMQALIQRFGAMSRLLVIVIGQSENMTGPHMVSGMPNLMIYLMPLAGGKNAYCEPISAAKLWIAGQATNPRCIQNLANIPGLLPANFGYFGMGGLPAFDNIPPGVLWPPRNDGKPNGPADQLSGTLRHGPADQLSGTLRHGAFVTPQTPHPFAAVMTAPPPLPTLPGFGDKAPLMSRLPSVERLPSIDRLPSVDGKSPMARQTSGDGLHPVEKMDSRAPQPARTLSVERRRSTSPARIVANSSLQQPIAFKFSVTIDAEAEKNKTERTHAPAGNRTAAVGSDVSARKEGPRRTSAGSESTTGRASELSGTIRYQAARPRSSSRNPVNDARAASPSRYANMTRKPSFAMFDLPQLPAIGLPPPNNMDPPQLPTPTLHVGRSATHGEAECQKADFAKGDKADFAKGGKIEVWSKSGNSWRPGFVDRIESPMIWVHFRTAEGQWMEKGIPEGHSYLRRAQ
jgi:hypothetical protein